MTARFGFIAALSTAIMTALTFAIAVMTPPMSGPFCGSGCYSYPYLDVASRFPRDYYWMAPACLAFLCYLAMMVALHTRSAPAKREYATLALVLASIATAVLVGDYYVQLAVVQPSLLAGEPDGIALISQYNPHGVFIALEELGYVLIGLSLAVMAAAMSRASFHERLARRIFVGGWIAIVAAFAVIAWRYGHAREYIFEVSVITVDFVALIAGGGVLAAAFRTAAATTNKGPASI